MAISHIMSSYKFYQKNHLENMIVERRNKEQMFRDFWTSNAIYFSEKHVDAKQRNSWESKASIAKSLESYELLKKKDDAIEKLKIRKDKLKALLESEDNKFQLELKELKRSQSNISFLRNQVEYLKLLQKEQEKQVKKMNAFESAITAEINSEDLKRQEEINKKNQLLESLKIKNKMKKQLQQQMDQIKRMDEQAKLMEAEEKELRRQKQHFNEVQQMKILVDEQRKLDTRKQNGKKLLCQHAAILRLKSHQIQKELMEDNKLLEQLVLEEDNKQVEIHRNLIQVKIDAQYIIQIFNEQLKLEKAREAELDLLYREEAAKLWDKREEEWHREKVARQSLFQQVIEGCQKEIDEELAHLRIDREQSILDRENLLVNLRLLHQQIKYEDANHAGDERLYRPELNGQNLNKNMNDLQEEIAHCERFESNELQQQQLDEQQILSHMQLLTDSQNTTSPRSGIPKQAWS